jgi:hypothetical protein
MLLAALRAGVLGAAGKGLISDDAGQFNFIMNEHALCWVHELRHYKLIETLYEENRQKVENFLTRAWTLYRTIKMVRENLTEEKVKIILQMFNEVFGEDKNGFSLLERQKKLSRQKMDKLLAPLWNKDLPMHNNQAELDIRGRVIKRKISLFNKSMRGAYAWDVMLSLKESCRKLKLSFYQRVLNTLSYLKQPSLAQIAFAT